MHALNTHQRVAFVRDGYLITSEELSSEAIGELLDLLDLAPIQADEAALDADHSGDLN